MVSAFLQHAREPERKARADGDPARGLPTQGSRVASRLRKGIGNDAPSQTASGAGGSWRGGVAMLRNLGHDVD
jgi:hypothetical protein